MGTEAVEAAIDSALSSYSLNHDDLAIDSGVSNLGDLLASSFTNLELDNSIVAANFKAFWMDIFDLVANDPDIQAAVDSIFAPDLSSLSKNDAIAALQQYADTIMAGLSEEQRQDYGSAFTGENLYDLLGFSVIDQSVGARIQELAKSAEDPQGALTELNNYVNDLDADAKKTFLEASKGTDSWTAAIELTNQALEKTLALTSSSNFIGTNSEAYQTYQDRFSDIQSYLEQARNGSFTVGDASQAVIELGLDSSQIDFKGDWLDDFVDVLENEAEVAWDEFITKLGDIDDPNMQGWINQLREVHDKALAAAKANTELANSLNKMSGLVTNMQSLSSAYETLASGEAISLEDFSALAENFGNLPSFDNFVDSVAGLKSVTGEAQEAFSRLAAEAIYSSEIIDQIIAQNGEYTETQKALLIAMLDEVGVVNSEAVAMNILEQAQARVQAQKILLRSETLNFTDATNM